ncbi:MiaB/RimO family radical SAM methylthiotransferase [Thermophilibacter mediterraneus]|uniref:MiaB/RimO family radical SAM methylthiotransferase n=1 Tax=Thermophilibacter mediterraneus TaxID=1871031 RepID=UPI00235475EA|nr:MiaB/RimO family radical SAM methylthiotransferase [Thermophilibacter mediterraneus]
MTPAPPTTSGPAPARRPGVALVNLGCRVNRVELDLMASELERAGAEVVGEREAAAVVVNTCAVTGEAEAKTRKAVRRVATLPQRPLVVATGCVANLFSDELEALAPGVVVERDKARVAARVIEGLGLVPQAPAPAGDDPAEACASPAHRDAPTPTGRTRPGIKIQDGCDNRCTYCIVWRARGRARSLAADEVLLAVREARARGAREVVLTGINLGSYRDAAAGDLALPGLLDLLLERTDVERIRLSSIEPPDVTPELCAVMAAAGERVAPFLHVCLQSGCDETLRRMARVYRTDLFRHVAATAREAVPGIALGTDLIVGFPGETDAEFEASLAFCREMRFARMHVFRYSRRPGTPAATMPGQVPAPVSAERGRRARELADEMRLAQARSLVGEKDLVVVQSPGRGVSGGLFDAAVDPALPVDSLVRVRVTGVRGDATLETEPL